LNRGAILEINNKKMINWWQKLDPLDRILNVFLSLILIVFWHNDLALVGVLITGSFLCLAKMVSRKNERARYLLAAMALVQVAIFILCKTV
jgi:hypothetical protein